MTGGVDGTIRFWDAGTGEPKQDPWRVPRWLRSLAWSPDGRRVAVGTGHLAPLGDVPSGEARLYEYPSGKLVFDPLPFDCVTHVAFDPTGRLLEVTTAEAGTCADMTTTVQFGSLRVVDVESGRQLGERLKLGATQGTTPRWATACRRSPGDRLVLGAADGEIRAVDPTRGTILLRSQGMGQLGELRAGTSGRLIVAGRLTGETEVHDGLKGGLVCPPLQQTGMLTAVALSPDERWVATGGFSGSSRIWEVRTGQPMTPSLRQGSMVFDLEFLPGSEQLATTSQDTTARIWTLTRTDMPVRQLEAVATVLSGRRISTAEGLLRVPEKELIAAGSQVRAAPRAFAADDLEKSRAWNTREAEDHAAEGRWAEAVPYFDRAIGAGPPRATLHFERGSALAELGQWDRAASDFQQAVTLRDSDAELWGRPCCKRSSAAGSRLEPGRPAPRC